MTKWKAVINYGEHGPPAEFEFETDDAGIGFANLIPWLLLGPSHDWSTVQNIVITPQR